MSKMSTNETVNNMQLNNLCHIYRNNLNTNSKSHTCSYNVTQYFLLVRSPKPKAQVSFSDRNLSVVIVAVAVLDWTNFKQTRHEIFFGDEYSSLFKAKWRKKFIDILKSSSKPLHGPVSTKLGTKHPWVIGIQGFQMKDHAFFQRGDKNTWTTFKRALGVSPQFFSFTPDY